MRAAAKGILLLADDLFVARSEVFEERLLGEALEVRDGGEMQARRELRVMARDLVAGSAWFFTTERQARQADERLREDAAEEKTLC